MIKLLEGEQIVLQKRKHWYALAAESFGFVILTLLPFVLIAAGLSTEEFRPFVLEYFNLIVFKTSAWLLVTWMVFFVVWTNYYLDVFIVTNFRVIDIEQHGLFSRDLVEMHISNIEDIKVAVNGILASLMNFGDLHIQTAGESREVIIRRIAHPRQVQEVLLKYHTEAVHRQ